MDLEQLPLRDLHLPEAVGWWPPAPGWWALFALAVLVLAYLLSRAWLSWRYHRARRVALKELARLRRAHRADPDPVGLGIRLSELLRRVALAYSPRSAVAGLTGRRWLEWLDHGLDEKLFTEGPGRSLAELPYRGTGREAPHVDVDALIEAVQRRLATPFPESR